MIALHTYEVGGMDFDDNAIAREYYDLEVGSNQTGYVEMIGVGLMYLSDYGFAISPEYWSTNLNSYESTINNNWL